MARSIKLVDLEEEISPSGEKLLHPTFEDKYGYRYKWQKAPWRDKEWSLGVERLFFKALEVEEWNESGGVWDQELKRAAKKIPQLEEFKLPVKIQVGEQTSKEYEKIENRFGKGPGTAGKILELRNVYKFGIDILSAEAKVKPETIEGEQFLCIGKVSTPWEELGELIAMEPKIVATSKEIKALYPQGDVEEAEEKVSRETKSSLFGFGGIFDLESLEGAFKQQRMLKGKEVGARFYVYTKAEMDRTELEVIGKEIKAKVRSLIRKKLGDFKAFEQGFEEGGNKRI